MCMSVCVYTGCHIVCMCVYWLSYVYVCMLQTDVILHCYHLQTDHIASSTTLNI